jgi:uncharacterized protein YbjT (DUF2867 family)
MRILVTGAAGLIGRHVVAALGAAGHRVVCCVRDPVRTERMFPTQESVRCDFNRDTRLEDWLPRLRGVDAVVNCAGILQERRRQSMVAIHAAAPKALFEACAKVGVRRLVQISALGVAPEVDTEYAQSKLAADRHLQTLDLDWVILRPSLAYTGAGSFGGTSLFRGLAALPIVPLVGDGRQMVQPIHMPDLTAAVRRLLEDPAVSHRIINVVGPEPMALRDMLTGLRCWLGLPPARFLAIPRPLARGIARIADVVAPAGTITTTAIRMLERGNTADPAPFITATGIRPRRFADGLAVEPAHVQDRWHARLYFLRPLLRVVIGLFFLCTGLGTFLFWPKADSLALLRAAHIPEALLPLAYWAGWLFDVVLGLALLLRWRVRLVGGIMLVASLFYLVFVTIAEPWQWIHPVTPLGIVFPLMVATLVMMAIEDDR